MTPRIQSPKERYGLNIRPLPLATQEAFRRQAAARGMTQAAYFEALMAYAERSRATFSDPEWWNRTNLTPQAIILSDEFERLGLKRVIT